MHGSLERILLLLAGSGLSPKDIHQGLVELGHVSPGRVVESVQLLRRQALNHSDKARDSILRDTRQPQGLKGAQGPGHDVATRVEYLLRAEAGLRVDHAALALLTSLARDRSDLAATVKPPNKESFSLWLRKLLRDVPPSVLLHHATLVRNRYVHRTEQDWPLRQE